MNRGIECDVELKVRNDKPHRLSEIWQLDKEKKIVVVLGLEGIVQFNAVGLAIWLRLDGRHTIEQIIEELTKIYPDQERNRLETDVMSFINHLVANHLVILNWHPLMSRRLPERLEGIS